MEADKVVAKLALLRSVLEESFDTRPLDELSVAFDYAAGPIPVACYCEINPSAHALIFRGIFGPTFSADQRPIAAEYIHRVNYSLPLGNWAIDLDSGDVRWKLGVYFGTEDLSAGLMREVVDASLYFIYRHIFGLVKILNGKGLAEAMAAIGEDHGVGAIARKSREA